MIARTRLEACPSDLLLDAWAAAELDAKVVAQLEKHLSHCSDCQQRHASFEHERAEFLEAAPNFEAQRKLAGATLPTRKSSGEQKTRGLAAFAVGLGAIGLFCVLSMRPWEKTPASGTAHGPHLSVSVKRGQLVVPAASGVAVQAGDVLRFAYSTDLDAYLALLNVEARGVRAYFPITGSQAQHIHPGNEVPLDFSVELDASPGVERVLGVFCRTPFEIHPCFRSCKPGERWRMRRIAMWMR